MKTSYNMAAKCIYTGSDDRPRMQPFYYSKREERESRQCPAIPIIPELSHDLTEEALYGVRHVHFSPLPEEILQTWLFMRHRAMK